MTMRWLVRFGLGLLALAVAVLGGGYLYLRGSLPELSGQAMVSGLGGPVKITRDRHGIPHIYGNSADDAYFGLGYAHAQDRLWQMEINRRTAAGRLSEVFGDATLDADKFLRTLDIKGYSQRALAHLEPETRRALDAYAAGVNAYLAGRRGPLPPEFIILGVRPEPWTPADTIGWGKMMAWDLAGNWSNELARMRLASRLTAAQIQEFFPPYPGDAPVALADLGALYRSIGQSMDLARLAAAMPAAPEGIGSNNWVLSGRLTASGKPLLANDPHLGLATPAVWYFAHLSAPGLNAIGATLPGVPAVVLGRNDRIAWGFTNTGPDTQDLYLEKIDPARPDHYIAPDGARPFQTRTETIAIKGKAPLEIRVRATRHGPVISDVGGVSGRGVAPGHVIAFAWTSLTDDDRTAQALQKIPRARDWASFVEAARDFLSPQQNMVFADIEGNIGYIAPARIPIRKPENDLKGLTPAPGWDARYDWTGYVPFDELPRTFNPPSGRVVTANHKIVPDSYPHFLTSEWTEPYRARRIEQMIAERKAHSIESFRDIQADVRSEMVRDFLPLMLAAPAADADAARWRDRLANWDGRTLAEKPESLVFQAWYRELTRLIYADELGNEFDSLWRPRPVFLHNVLTDHGGQSRWCDNIATPARESCPELITRALPLALADLKRRYGADPDRWHWGEAHAAVSDHKPFSKVDLLRRLFELRVPTPGDAYSVNVGRNDIRDERQPFANTHAASLRAIYTLDDPDRSLFIHSTGQSGNPLSPLFANFVGPWSEVRYVPMTTRPEEIAPGSLGTLVLIPR